MYIYKNKTRIVFKKLVLRFSNLFNPVLPSKLQARKCVRGPWGGEHHKILYFITHELQTVRLRQL
jgi:hypothetical protein